MTPFRSTLVALTFCAFTLPALAAQSAAFDRCMNSGAAANGNMGAMLACAQQEYARQDRDLNREYQDLLPRLEPAAATHLRSAQRAWITFRDAEAASYVGDGSQSQLDALLTKAELTEQRAGQLRQRAADLILR